MSVIDPIDPIRGPRTIEILANEGFAYIWVVGAVISSVFLWILFRHIKLPPDFIKIEHGYLQSATLALYYFCWVAGTRFDCKTQKWVYLADPGGRHFPLRSILVVTVLTLVALGLLSTKDEESKFALFLSALLIVNVIAWLHLLTRVLPIINTSAEYYRGKDRFLELEALYVVAHYINGRWQWTRFFGMGIIIAVLVVISFNDEIRQLIAVKVFSSDTEAAYTLLPDFVFLAFVIFAEGWIWLQRLRTRLTMKVIYALDDYYMLNPNPTKMSELKEHWKTVDNLKWWKTIRRSMRLTSGGKKKRKTKSLRRRSTEET